MNLYIQFCCFNGEPCSYFEIYLLHKPLVLYFKKLQYNANVPLGSHFLFEFLIMVVQINNPTLPSNLTLTRNVHAKYVKKQLRNIIVSLLRYVLLLKSRYFILDWQLLKVHYADTCYSARVTVRVGVRVSESSGLLE